MTGKASIRGKRLQKQRNDTLRQNGLCITCKKPTENGYSRCPSCLEKRRKSNKIARLRKNLNSKGNSYGFPDYH